MKKVIIFLILTYLNCSSSKEVLIAELDNEVVQLYYWSLISNRINLFEKTNNTKYQNTLLHIYVNGKLNNELSILRLEKTVNELEKIQTVYIKDKEPFLVVETESDQNSIKPLIREAKYYVKDWNKSDFIVFDKGKYIIDELGMREFVLLPKGKKTKMQIKKTELEFIIELAEKFKSE